MGIRQGCDSRTRGNHARGLKNSLHAVFTRYSRGNHVRYTYGIVLKYTVNTGESVFLLVVGGRRVFKFRVWCACLSLYSLFLSFSLRALSSRLVRAPSAAVFIAMDSEPIPVTEITSDWRKFHFPRDSHVITRVNLNLGIRGYVRRCAVRPCTL